MKDHIDSASWRSIQEAVEHTYLFQKQVQDILAFSTGINDANEVMRSVSMAMVDFQTFANQAQEAFRLTANLTFHDIQTQNTAIQAFLDSSATNALQALQSSISMEWLHNYFTDLSPQLDRKPNTHEIIEDAEVLVHPETRAPILRCAPSLNLLTQLRASTLSRHDLSWRQLEELVTDLLDQEGYEVTLGRGTKDEGTDIIAVKRLPGAGLFMTIWQAKKLKPGKPVGIATIRELADTRLEHKASKGIIVTTTSLTRGALTRIERDCYLLGKIDGNDLKHWIRTGYHS